MPVNQTHSCAQSIRMMAGTLVLVVCAACGWSAEPTQETGAAKADRHRAAWMAKGSYGVMTHYLIGPPGNTPVEKTVAFNQTVDGFDIETYVRQFEESGADWLIFTIGQNTGYYCSPNAFLDQALPGHTSKRDLALELARRVHQMGKHFIAYLPAEVAGQSEEIKQAFAWDPADQTAFLQRYQQFIRDYSLKFGKLNDGWWFDGCYSHIHQGKWNWQDFCEAARAGNPDAAVALNDGAFCCGYEKPVSPLQDYHAGEVHMLEDGKIRFDFMGPPEQVYTNEQGHLRLRDKEPVFYMPKSQYVDGVQWHALVPVNSSFNAPTIPAQHYQDTELFQFVRNCKAVGGAVTLNVPVDNAGHIPAESAAQLQRLGKALK